MSVKQPHEVPTKLQPILPRLLADVWNQLSAEEQKQAERWLRDGAPTVILK